MKVSYEDAGFAVMTWGAVPAVMSCFLPSPSTGYDKASGAISTGGDSVKRLRRDEILGSLVSLAIAAAASVLIATKVGSKAMWVFVGAVLILGLYLFEFESAVRQGLREAG